jgi:hypothetical protein
VYALPVLRRLRQSHRSVSDFEKLCSQSSCVMDSSSCATGDYRPFADPCPLFLTGPSAVEYPSNGIAGNQSISRMTALLQIDFLCRMILS